MTLQRDRIAPVLLVAGGAGAIGSAVAAVFAGHGFQVVVGYKSGRDAAERVASSLPGVGHRCLHLDVSDSESLSLAHAELRGSGARLDVVVNCAAVTRIIPHGNLDALSDEEFDRIMSTNVRGAFALVREFRSLLEAGGGGLIVNVSSTSASTGRGSNIAYCASKAALDSLTRSLARVLAPAVRVVSVSPGVVDSEFTGGRDRDALLNYAMDTPMRHLVDPQDVARAVWGVWDSLVWSTGNVIVMDGGASLG